MSAFAALPAESAGLRLARIVGEDLRLCEPVMFVSGRAAVDTVLRRAALSGRVEIGAEIENHFADVLAGNGDLIETVTLDAKSYRSLKTHWMRCRVERNAA